MREGTAGAEAPIGTSFAVAAPPSFPPRRIIRARRPLTLERIAAESDVRMDGVEVPIAERLLSRQRRKSRELAEEIGEIHLLWVEGADDQADVNAVVIANTLRTDLPTAERLLRDARLAVTDLPLVLRRLAAGEISVPAFEHLVRKVRPLSPEQRRVVDSYVAEWDLENIPADRYRRELSLLVTWWDTDAARPGPAAMRDVRFEILAEGSGVACLSVLGPIPEIYALMKQVDGTARSVQRAQRRALETGEQVPFDLDGDVVASGHPLPLAALRYAILTRGQLETPGVERRGADARVNVVIPALTLLGVTDAPGTLDGVIPLPAPLARRLAAGARTWHRILTDPVDGAFLPVPAAQYRPTTAMAEHLRLRDPVCAVPGCIRGRLTPAEIDHIEEFCHEDPGSGGATEIRNLHRLCWWHHRLKTERLIDPEKAPDGTTTHWEIGQLLALDTRQNTDLLTPAMVELLEDAWAEHEAERLIASLVPLDEEIAAPAEPEPPPF